MIIGIIHRTSIKIKNCICSPICAQYASKFRKLSSGHRNGKGNFHSNPKKRQCQRMFKLPHNGTHLTRYQSNAQILQIRLQQYVNRELPDIQADFRKGRGTRHQIANIHWIIKKVREVQKTSISALLTMLKPLTVWITINCRKF